MEQGGDLVPDRRVSSSRLFFPERHRIVIVGEGVPRLPLVKVRELLRDARKGTGRGKLYSSHKEIRFGILRVEIGCLAEALRGIVIERAGKECGSERREHARGFWPRFGSFCENITGLQYGAMVEEFGAPREVVLLAGIDTHRLRELVDG